MYAHWQYFVVLYDFKTDVHSYMLKLRVTQLTISEVYSAVSISSANDDTEDVT